MPEAVNAHLDQDIRPDPVLGDTLRLRYTVKTKTGAPMDLSTATGFTFTLRERDGDIRVTKTLGLGVTITDVSGGVVTVEVGDEETAALSAGLHYHQLRMHQGTASKTVAAGEARFRPQGI
jgi:hypothetical protein